MSEQIGINSFKELIEWSEQNGLTKKELDERAIKICVKCVHLSRCANFEVKDWCYRAVIPSIVKWAENVIDVRRLKLLFLEPHARPVEEEIVNQWHKDLQLAEKRKMKCPECGKDLTQRTLVRYHCAACGRGYWAHELEENKEDLK